MADNNRPITQGMIMKALDWGYEKAVNGLPVLGTAQGLANDFLKGEGKLETKVNKLIALQDAICGAAGFVANLGGFITLPVGLPANIVSVLYVQIRMIAAIAIMGGHDVKYDRVKSLVYLCLVGSSANDVIKDVGINVGTKTATKLLEKLPGDILIKINQQVDFRLVTKFGTTGAINLVDLIPVVGAGVAAAFDAVATHIVGLSAGKMFISPSFKEPTKHDKPITRQILADSPFWDVLRGNVTIKEETLNKSVHQALSNDHNEINSLKFALHDNYLDSKAEFSSNGKSTSLTLRVTDIVINFTKESKEILFTIEDIPEVKRGNHFQNIFMGLSSFLISSLYGKDKIYDMLLKDVDAVSMAGNQITVDTTKVPAFKQVLEAKILGINALNIIRIDNVKMKEGEILIHGGLKIK